MSNSVEYIYFTTDQFNLSEIGEHFINDCCFGEDLSEWLKENLVAHDIVVKDIYQEDWGWDVDCTHGEESFSLGVGGVPDDEGSYSGEWLIFVTKRRTFKEKLFGKNKQALDEAIYEILLQVLNKAEFTNIYRETSP